LAVEHAGSSIVTIVRKIRCRFRENARRGRIVDIREPLVAPGTGACSIADRILSRIGTILSRAALRKSRPHHRELHRQLPAGLIRDERGSR
jgi:hypothetical protein